MMGILEFLHEIMSALWVSAAALNIMTGIVVLLSVILIVVAVRTFRRSTYD